MEPPGTSVQASNSVDTTRYLVVFRTRQLLEAAVAATGPAARIVLINQQRKYFSVAPSVGTAEQQQAFTNQLNEYVARYGADVLPERKYVPDIPHEPDPQEPGHPRQPSLVDVLEVTGASAAWPRSNGSGVLIAVIDTGINGGLPDFAGRRAGQWSLIGQDAWRDNDGHGTMCATIAAGSKDAGGPFNGLAPGAGVISCRTEFYEGELTAIYDYLAGLARQRRIPIIANNSYGAHTGTPPSVGPADSLFEEALAGALDAGVMAIFSAGNNHALAGGAPNRCEPTSIWLHKCRGDVMTVGAVDLELRPWHYSSRGPGQFYGRPSMGPKPDVVAPVPARGLIRYGAGMRVMAAGWGTSGACAQVAALAALLASRDPRITRTEVFGMISHTAQTIGPRNCTGSGIIDCRTAVAGLA